MALTEEDKKYIVNEFLRSIKGISDKEYQKRIWIQGKGPECDDFYETCNRFFPVAEDIIENYTNFKLTEAQLAILKQFYKEFDEFSDENDFAFEFIDSPWWAKIMERAKEVLVAFDYKKE